MITMGFCERLSNELMLKMGGGIIENAPTYGKMFDHLSWSGYQVIVHPSSAGKRWTATVYYYTTSFGGEYKIKKEKEDGEVEYLQFDDWKEAADCGILLAVELMEKEKNKGKRLN